MILINVLYILPLTVPQLRLDSVDSVSGLRVTVSREICGTAVVYVANTDCWFIFHHILLTADTSNLNFTNILNHSILTVKIRVEIEKLYKNCKALAQNPKALKPKNSKGPSYFSTIFYNKEEPD